MVPIIVIPYPAEESSNIWMPDISFLYLILLSYVIFLKTDFHGNTDPKADLRRGHGTTGMTGSLFSENSHK